MNKPLVSIIIPTKNRQFYCAFAVKHILSLNDNNNFEIVVQDNSDDDSLKSQIDSLSDKRVIYNHHPGELSFVDNFSEAFEKSNGEYVCFIGDDDTILPIFFDAASFAKLNNIDCLVPSLGATYFWPSETKILGENRGRLTLFYVRKKCRIIDTKKGLSKLVANGGQDYQAMALARGYHGLVRRDCFDDVKKITGKYFYGLSPDIYNAVTLSEVCNKVVRCGFPITISGICPKSGSAASATGAHTGNLKDAPHFKGHNNYVWDKKIAYLYSVETIWAETVAHALQDINEHKLYEKFNIKRLMAYAWKNNKSIEKEVIEYCAENSISVLDLKFTLFGQSCKAMKTKIKKLFSTGKNDRLKFFEVNDIAKAEEIISSYLAKEIFSKLKIK